jgi:predicted transcriptional regulator
MLAIFQLELGRRFDSRERKRSEGTCRPIKMWELPNALYFIIP